jgi:hypothetical protein
LILSQANIPSGIMVSRQYGHAMGLADLSGPGARFQGFLVAETTAFVPLGLIDESMSDAQHWIDVIFD